MAEYPSRRWFIPKSDIAREVITADIQRYLGPDATVKPGLGEGEYAGQDGYIITAYRTLTSAMIKDLQDDSKRWKHEIANRDNKEKYSKSEIHQSRQYHGPSQPQPVYPPQQSHQQSHKMESAYGQQVPTGQYSATAQAAHQPGYTYNQAYSQAAAQYVTATDYHQSQMRTPPQYYAQQPQQAAQAHSQYYGAQQEQPRYSYPSADPVRDQVATPQYYSQQPSSTTQYYQQQGGAYRPSQSNDRRDRH